MARGKRKWPARETTMRKPRKRLMGEKAAEADRQGGCRAEEPGMKVANAHRKVPKPYGIQSHSLALLRE